VGSLLLKNFLFSLKRAESIIKTTFAILSTYFRKERKWGNKRKEGRRERD
jgi:hypothetical protein